MYRYVPSQSTKQGAVVHAGPRLSLPLDARSLVSGSPRRGNGPTPSALRYRVHSLAARPMTANSRGWANRYARPFSGQLTFDAHGELLVMRVHRYLVVIASE